MKTVILLLGSHASGKTTLARAFAKGTPKVFRKGKLVYTLFDNCAFVGTPKSGAQFNISIKFGFPSLCEALKHRDIVLVDTFHYVKPWIWYLNTLRNTRVVVVYLNLPAEVLLGRLKQRSGELTVKKIRHTLSKRKLMNVFYKRLKIGLTIPKSFVVITEPKPVDELLKILEEALLEVKE